MNPESYSPPPISPRQMYSYDRGLNKSWNIAQYKTPRIYQDPKMEVQKRAWASQKKGQKTDKYVTKKGFYMDYHIKVQKSLPSPSISALMQPLMSSNNLGNSRSKSHSPRGSKQTNN